MAFCLACPVNETFTRRVDMVLNKQSGIRELTLDEIHLVSGGGALDSYAFQGGAAGGMAGSVFGAAFTGTVGGATSYGIIGAALGFSFGLGWGIGTAIYNAATKSRS